MASEIKILRKFFDDILKKETIYHCNLSNDFILRFRCMEHHYPISKNYTLTIIKGLHFICNPILHEIKDNHLYIHRKRNDIELVEDFISSTDEELVLTYGRDILDVNIIQIINNSGVKVDLDDFSNFLQGIKI